MVFCSMTKQWNEVILSSNSTGSFGLILVYICREVVASHEVRTPASRYCDQMGQGESAVLEPVL